MKNYSKKKTDVQVEMKLPDNKGKQLFQKRHSLNIAAGEEVQTVFSQKISSPKL
jgi:hypothetical protein